MLLFTKLASKWPNLISLWEKVDQKLILQQNSRFSLGLKLKVYSFIVISLGIGKIYIFYVYQQFIKIKLIFFILIILINFVMYFAVENLLSFLYGCENAIHLANLNDEKGFRKIIARFFIGNFPQVCKIC